MYSIPLSVPDITQVEIDAVTDVLRSGALIDGPQVEEFERACALRVGRREAVAVGSGTAALHCCLCACGIAAGDEVITTPFSFVAAANGILLLDAKPVFSDIHPQTLNLDPAKLEAAITPRTRAIIAGEALGHPGGMEEIEQIARRHELVLLENACEGLGAKTAGRSVGTFGRASCLSFHARKQITTGEGGMILTDDDRFADLCRTLRNHGREREAWPSHARMGFSYRMDAMSAALGLAQISRIDEIMDRRRRVAREYFRRLIDNRYLTLPTIPETVAMSWYTFVVRLNDLFEPGDREEVINEMRGDGIECASHFAPVHLQPHIAQKQNDKPGEFPVCEYIAQRTIALPLYSALSSDQIERVCESLDRAIEKVLMGRCKGRF